MSHKGLVLNIGKCGMQFEDEQVELSKNEAIILRVLMENAGVIVGREDLTSMDELMSLKIGADDFITKPYDLQVLLAHTL